MIPKRNSLWSLVLATALLALSAERAAAQGDPAGDEPAAPTATPAPAPPPLPRPGEVAELVRRLGSEDWAEREAATRRLTEIGAPAHDALRAALASGDAEVRYRARLVLRAPLRTVKRLLDQLQRTGGGRDDDAFKAIVALGEEAVDPLVYVISRELADYEGKNDDRVKYAFDCLDRIGSKRAVEPLLGLLDKNLQRFVTELAQALRRSGEAEAKKGLMTRRASPEAGVRRAAVQVLGLFKGEDVIAALGQAVRDPDVAVRLEAVQALQWRASRVGRQPSTPRFIPGGQVIQIGGGNGPIIIGRNGGRRIRIVNGVIVNGGGFDVATAHRVPPKGPPSDEDKRLAALAADAILGALDDEHDQVQLVAIRALAALDDRRAIPRLRKVLDSGVEDERTLAAVEALARFEVRPAIPRMTALVDSPRGDIAEAATRALGTLKAQEAVPALVAKLVTPTATVSPAINQQTLVEALGEIADPRAFEPLAAYFDGAESLRPSVCVAIGRMPGEGPRAWLLERAKHADDIPTSSIALLRLEERGDEGLMLGDDEAVEEAAIAFLESRNAPKDDALLLLGRRGFRPAFDAIKALLPNSQEPDVQAEAIRALGELGDPKAIGPIKEIWKKTPEGDRVHEMAVIALSKLGDANVLNPSIELWKKRAEQAKGGGGADSALTELGILHLYQRDYAAAETCFAQIVEQCKAEGRTNEIASYNLACTHALCGRTEQALSWLKRSMDEGFHDWKHVDGDTDLDSIRDTSAFKAVREEMIRITSEEQRGRGETIFGGEQRIRFQNGRLVIGGVDDEDDEDVPAPDDEDEGMDEEAPAPPAIPGAGGGG